jgi:hypothetical protein
MPRVKVGTDSRNDVEVRYEDYGEGACEAYEQWKEESRQAGPTDEAGASGKQDWE